MNRASQKSGTPDGYKSGAVSVVKSAYQLESILTYSANVELQMQVSAIVANEDKVGADVGDVNGCPALTIFRDLIEANIVSPLRQASVALEFIEVVVRIHGASGCF